METNIYRVSFGPTRHATPTQPMFWSDIGWRLQFDGVDLPEAYEVYFAHPGDTEAKRSIGGPDGVLVLNEYLTSGKELLFWVYVPAGENAAHTKYTGRIPVNPRPAASEVEPTPEQADVITQTIAALNAAVEQTAADVEVADLSAQEAAAQADRAETAADLAEGSATAAASASADATRDRERAESAAQEASSSATTAAGSATEAAAAATAAAQSASDAVAAKNSATSSAGTATTQANAARSSANAASRSATRASTYENNARQRAQEAAASANAAAQSAAAAAGSATSAETAASTATTKAADAASAATTAATKAGEAAQSATAAQTAEATATTKASDAAASATAAAESARQSADAAQEIVDEALADYAQQDGSYEAMTAGNAAQLLSKKTTENAVPYKFRATPENADREYLDAIVGGTVAWNQLVAQDTTSITPIAGHIYFACIGGEYTFKLGASASYAVTGGQDILIDLTQMFGNAIATYVFSLGLNDFNAALAWVRRFIPKSYYPYNPGELMSVHTSAHKMVGFNQWDEEWVNGSYNQNGESILDPTRIRTKNPIRVIGGATYYMKTPTTIDIRFYDADDAFISDGYTRTVKNTTVTVPSDAAYLRFSVVNTPTYNHNICINLSDPARNGTYEPYVRRTYPLDSSITLRGIPKLDANNSLYYDGDTYESNGTVTRKIKEIEVTTCSSVGVASTGARYATYNIPQAIPELLENNFLSNAYRFRVNAPNDGGKWFRDSIAILYIYDERFTDMSTANAILAIEKPHFVYELATPTTETAEPFRNLQICDPDGMEEFVSTSIVPVGHVTRYPENLRAKIEGLPWNFNALIAMTETTTTASKAYAVGDYFILDNTLYCVASAIASGGTITPGTNAIATTIMDEIKSLA